MKHFHFTIIFCSLLLLGISNVYAVSEMHFQGRPEFINFSGDNMPAVDQLTSVMSSLGFNSPEGLTLLNQETDGLGMIHYRYQQTCNGYPVNATMWIVHTRNGKIESMNGVLYGALPTANTIGISNKAGYQAALNYLPSPTYNTTSTTGNLYWALPANNTSAQSFRLCYRFDIYARQPLARKYIFVDATTGSVISSEDRINEIDVVGTAHTAYSGVQPITTDSYNGSYRMREAGRGGGIQTYNLQQGTDYTAAIDFTSTNNIWNDIDVELDQYATDAHWGAETTYDFYKNTFNRNSVDNAGLMLVSYVHFSVDYLNAFWDGSVMTYGDGCCGYTPLTALDICGHEMSHGVTQYTAALIYQNESGALNEGFSDCMGTSIEFYGKPASANWTIGEDIGAPFRNMADPKQFQQPNTYLGQYWYTGGSDDGGVHTNSGVLNYWFYLVSEGGSGTNDNGNSYNFSGVTIQDAEAILYRAQSVYMFPSAQYADARTCTVQAATDLYGSCSPQVIAVQNAWYAVGVGSISGSSSVSITSSPGTQVCPGGTITFTATSVNGGTAPTYQWEVNGSVTGTNSPTFATNTLNNGDVVTCILTSNATCVAGVPVASNSIAVTVGTVPASVSISSNPAGLLCSGSPAIFTAAPVNGGTNPSYQWKVNSADVGSNSSTFTTSSLNDNDTVKCIMTSGISCATNNPATSIPIIVNVVTCTGLNVSFKSDDTVQVSQVVNLINTSVGYSDFMWSFCSSVPEDSPTFTNLGNLNGELDAVDYTSIREENGQFYSFTSRALDGELAGAVYGSSFNNDTPKATTWFNGVGQMAGIQSLLDTATGKETFMSVGLGYLTHTWDGSSLASPFGYCCVDRIPYTNTGITYNASDLQIVKFKGTLYGFILDYDDTSGFFVTLNFGNSLYNTPIANKYRYPSYITTPSGLCVRYNEQTNHFILFTCSQSPQQLARFDLGSSPGGIPTFIDASNPFPNDNGLRDVAIIQECGGTYGLALFNGDTGKVVKFHFAGDNISAGYTNSYTLPLSLKAGMINPYSFSEFYNADTTTAERVMFITDNSAQLIRMDMSRCTNEDLPSTHATNPSSIFFNAPGTYTISLTGGIGTAYEETYCKTIVVKPCFGLATASVSIAVSPGNTECPGTPLTFTATPVNGGTPIYNWEVNGVNVGANSPTYTTSTLQPGDKVYCQMTSSESCISGNPATSDTITINWLPTNPASVSITANPTNNVCSGKPAVFTASSSNIGTLSYQWKVNGVDEGSNSSTYSNSSLNNHDTIYCQMSSSSLCVTGNPATSNKIVMTVIPTVTASVSIVAMPGDSICPGTSVAFNATPTNGGTPVYQWKLNGSNVGTNSSTYTNAALANTNQVSCVMTSNATCVLGSPASSNIITMTVYPNIVGSVNVTASPGNAVCVGSAINFTATPVSGATATYQWKLNSANVGTNSTHYSNSSLATGDTVDCVAVLTGHCIIGTNPISNKIVIAINPYAIAGTVSAEPDSVCPGSTSVLTLSGSQGSPIQWQAAIAPPNFNGISDVGDTAYNASVSGTTYYRAIVGVGKCPDTSLSVKVFALPQPYANFTSTVNGKQVNFVANSVSSDVISYHWNFGDDSTSTKTDPVHTYLTTDTFTVCLTANNKYDCPDTTCQKIDLRPNAVSTVTANTALHVYPSPFIDKLFISFNSNITGIESIELLDVLGRKVTGETLTAMQGSTLQLSVPEIASGMYYLFVKTGERSYVVEVVKQQ